MAVRKLLLFDIDATLLHAHGEGGRAMQQAGEQVFGQAFSVEGVEFPGSLDSVIYDQVAEHNRIENHHEHHERFLDTYLRTLEHRLQSPTARIAPAPGMLELLEQLNDRRQCLGDIELALLTGNYAAAAPIKLRAAGIHPEWFAFGAFGDEGTIRADLTELAMQRFEERHGRKIAGGDVIVLGDTPRDIECAKVHGCVAFGIATGSYSVDALRQAGANVAVEDLRDPAPLLMLLDT